MGRFLGGRGTTAGGKYHAWLASTLPSIPRVSAHLSHRHPLRGAALQENLMVQGYFLAQRLLIEVLAQVWEKGKGPTTQSGRVLGRVGD